MSILKRPEFHLYGILLLLALLSYGFAIPDLGLYGDDPAFLYTYHRYGADGFQAYLGGFRPFASWIYQLITPLFQESIWPYHVLLLFLRWLMAVLFYHLLAKVWPERSHLFSWAACLMVVYPGFTQQAMALEFVLHFATFCLLMVSMLFMVQSILQPRRFIPYTIASLLTGLSMFGIEYFTGLELLRPVLLAVLLWRRDTRQRWKTLLLHWLPYLLLFAGYLYWRGVVFKSVYYQPTVLANLQANPWAGLLLLGKAIGDVFTAGLRAWTVIFQMPSGGNTLWYYLGLLAGCIIFLGLYLYKSYQRVPPKTIAQDEAWARNGVFLALFCLLTGGIPVWAAGLQVTLSYSWDRTTLPFMAGACLLFVTLVVRIFKPRHIPIVLSVSLAFMVVTQFQTMNSYRREWDITRTYLWQIVWRAPQIRPDTMILTFRPPARYLPDNSLTALLNWTYDPDNHSPEVRYKLFDLQYRLSALPGLDPGIPVKHFGFSGSTSQALVIFAGQSSCLRVLAPEDASIPYLSEAIIQALPLSDTGPILPGEYTQPPAFLGPEPEHGWCYYLTKADLAAQQGDWLGVTEIEGQAARLGLTPFVPAEWTVFIKGYAQTEQVGRALELSDQAVGMDTAIRPLICEVWKNLSAGITDAQIVSVEAWQKAQNCP